MAAAPGRSASLVASATTAVGTYTVAKSCDRSGKSPIRAKPISGLVSATTADSPNPRYFLVELFGWVIDDIDSHCSESLYERFSGKLSETGRSRKAQEPFAVKLGCHRHVNTLAD